MVLEPGRGIHQQSETRRVRFRETVLAEALNLLVDPLGKFLRQTVGLHPGQELHAKLIDHARPPPGRHRAAELVGLARREARRHHGQPHRLLLKNRYAQCFMEHRADRLAGILHFLFAHPPPQERMDHLPLDRPGPHDRHLDHQVVKRPRPQSRQHRHLGPALDLEHAQRVGPADHVVYRRVVGRDRRQGELEKGVRNLLCEATCGPFRQKVPDTFFIH